MDSDREPVADWPYPTMPSDLHGRVCLITGATNGIGLATAKGLCAMGARLILVSRDRTRGEEAALAVRAAGRGPVDVLLADLSSQRSVRALAAEYLERFSGPEVLIHNAAIVPATREVTVEGIEMQLAVNHLAPFLLTHLLLDAMKKAAPARIVVVASQAERGGRIDFDDLQAERGYEQSRVYSQSKLANVMFTYELAERLAGTGVTANCLHPGVVRTNVLDALEERRGLDITPATAPGLVARAKSAARSLLGREPVRDWALTPEEGARTTIYVATAPELEKVSGRYFREAHAASTSPQSIDRPGWQRLWDVSAKLTGV